MSERKWCDGCGSKTDCTHVDTTTAYCKSCLFDAVDDGNVVLNGPHECENCGDSITDTDLTFCAGCADHDDCHDECGGSCVECGDEAAYCSLPCAIVNDRGGYCTSCASSTYTAICDSCLSECEECGGRRELVCFSCDPASAVAASPITDLADGTMSVDGIVIDFSSF